MYIHTATDTATNTATDTYVCIYVLDTATATDTCAAFQTAAAHMF